MPEICRLRAPTSFITPIWRRCWLTSALRVFTISEELSSTTRTPRAPITPKMASAILTKGCSCDFLTWVR